MLCIPNATDVFRILLKNKTFVNNLLGLLIWPRLLLICNVYICKYNIEYMIVKKADNGPRGHHHFVSCAQVHKLPRGHWPIGNNWESTWPTFLTTYELCSSSYFCRICAFCELHVTSNQY